MFSISSMNVRERVTGVVAEAKRRSGWKAAGIIALEESKKIITAVRRQARQVIEGAGQRAVTGLERRGMEAVHKLSQSEGNNG